MPKPVPVPDEVSKPFWDACDEQRLVVQYCTSCNRWQYPPQQACAECGSGANLEFRPVSGKGTIYTYVVMHDGRVGLLQPYQPFNIAVVQLEEAPEINMLTNLPGTETDKVPIGAKVQVEFEEVAPGKRIPQFRVVG